MAWPLAFLQALRLTALCTRKRRSSRLRENFHLHFRYTIYLACTTINSYRVSVSTVCKKDRHQFCIRAVVDGADLKPICFQLSLSCHLTMCDVATVNPQRLYLYSTTAGSSCTPSIFSRSLAALDNQRQ
jgi:hypothetical protein